MLPTMEEQPSGPILTDAPRFEYCLCLICRQVGHLAQSCSYLPSGTKNQKKPSLVLRSPPPSPPFMPFLSSVTQALCEHCEQISVQLNCLESAHPFVRNDKNDFHRDRTNRKMNRIPPLGPIQTLRLLSTCPLCCLIFNITYLSERDLRLITDPDDDSEGQLVLVPAWTIHRLERDLNWEGYQIGKEPYAKCIYTAVTSAKADKDTSLIDIAVDAIGIEEISRSIVADTPALGIRKVDPRTPDYSRIKGWFDRCDQLHPTTCRPAVLNGLGTIKLIDVETRRIVRYPSGGCHYVALSYMWGGVEQPSFNLGDILPNVPATLEDAIKVTRQLGKRYFWADSLCIDQRDSGEKAEQIALMGDIYAGAWATIINVSGQSARSGLARVGTLEGVTPQLSCVAGGRQLLSTMPTLSQQISGSPWGTRAWTFQEGKLSPRCLFFTTHQVYFECNSSQCCESLDDSYSPFHLLSNKQQETSLENLAMHLDETLDDKTLARRCIIGQGVLRNPFRPIVNISPLEEPDIDESFRLYQKLVSSYTAKKMTEEIDSLNAFSAMLAWLKDECYSSGFSKGLPKEDLPRALLWTHAAQPRRRPGFPAWSWAGWEGALMDTVVDGTMYSCPEDMPPLYAWRHATSGESGRVYFFSPTSDIWTKMGLDQKDNDNNGSEVDEEDSISSEEEQDHDHDSIGSSDQEQDRPPPPSPKEWNFWKMMRGPRTKKTTKNKLSRAQLERKLKDDRLKKEIAAMQERMKEDPVLSLSNSMTVPSKRQRRRNIRTNSELLIRCIVIQLTFRTVKYQSPSELPPDKRMREDARAEKCIVDLKREDGSNSESELTFYGHNAAELIETRNGKKQQFLLLARERFMVERVLGVDAKGIRAVSERWHWYYALCWSIRMIVMALCARWEWQVSALNIPSCWRVPSQRTGYSGLVRTSSFTGNVC